MEPQFTALCASIEYHSPDCQSASTSSIVPDAIRFRPLIRDYIPTILHLGRIFVAVCFLLFQGNLIARSLRRYTAIPLYRYTDQDYVTDKERKLRFIVVTNYRFG